MKRCWIILLCLPLHFCSQNYMTLAKVNGETISVGDFKQRLTEIQFDPKFVAESELLTLKKNLLNEMIEDKIVQQEAKSEGIKVDQAEVNQANPIENLDETLSKQKMSKAYWEERTRQRLVAQKLFDKITKDVPQPTEVLIKEIYDKNPTLFHQQEQVHLMQIVLKTETEAAQVQRMLAEGKDFAELAKNLSMTMDATTGGDLGFVAPGLLPESLEKKVFGMKVGSVSSTYEYESQFFIFKVLEKKEEKQLSFEESRIRIQSMLFQKAKDAAYSQWLQEKTIQAKIKRNYELLQENIRP